MNSSWEFNTDYRRLFTGDISGRRAKKNDEMEKHQEERTFGLVIFGTKVRRFIFCEVSEVSVGLQWNHPSINQLLGNCCSTLLITILLAHFSREMKQLKTSIESTNYKLCNEDNSLFNFYSFHIKTHKSYPVHQILISKAFLPTSLLTFRFYSTVDGFPRDFLRHGENKSLVMAYQRPSLEMPGHFQDT